MPILKKTTLILTFLGLMAFSWIGCSDGTIVTYVDSPGATGQAEPVELYFPLDEGYTTIYNVTYSIGNSEQVTFTAGRTVSFQGINAVEWIGRGANSIDTGYFYPTGNALYYYDATNAQPEKLLQLTLNNGTSWATNNINSNGFTDIITGTLPDTTGNPYINAKDFPTISAVSFTVESTEALELNTGTYFSQTVRLSTPNGSRMNYYWYAQGIGLVSYVIGASTTSYPNGDIVGEIVNYGI